EDGELDKYKSTDKNEYYYRLIAMWNKDLMKFEQEYQELTESEKQEYNGHLIDEMEVE
ncbi:replication protein, partial [Bacillus paranthracis]